MLISIKISRNSVLFQAQISLHVKCCFSSSEMLNTNSGWHLNISEQKTFHVEMS